MRRGVSAALYRFTIDWAQQEHYTHVDFRSCRPFLVDGVFRFKRKWGMTAERRCMRRTAFACRIHRLSPAVRSFLLTHPMVLLARKGLEGIVFAPEGEPVGDGLLARAKKLYWTPGLRALRITSLPVVRDGEVEAHGELRKAVEDARRLEASP